jgi:hypothetical protein
MGNMAAPLLVCTKEEQRSVSHFLWSEGVQGAEVHMHLCAQHGDSALSQRLVYKWIEMFKKGWKNVTDADRLGYPSTYTSNEKLEEARAVVLEDRRVSVAIIGQELNVCQGLVYAVVYNSLGFVCAKWIPRQLTEECKQCLYNDHSLNTELGSSPPPSL